MSAPKWLAALRRRVKGEKPPEKLPDNPYHRFYTKNRSFEDLTRPKGPPKK